MKTARSLVALCLLGSAFALGAEKASEKKEAPAAMGIAKAYEDGVPKYRAVPWRSTAVTERGDSLVLLEAPAASEDGGRRVN